MLTYSDGYFIFCFMHTILAFIVYVNVLASRGATPSILFFQVSLCACTLINIVVPVSYI